MKIRPRVPIALPLIALGLIILGLLAGPFIQSRATPEQLDDNVLLSAIPFILIFVAIILFFITLIVLIATWLSNSISARAYKIVESILIAGIVLGIIGMFQPWLFAAYKYGFLVLLFSTLSFIVWSHVTPRHEEIQEQTNPVSVGDTL
jgi:hypothetical protein